LLDFNDKLSFTANFSKISQLTDLQIEDFSRNKLTDLFPFYLCFVFLFHIIRLYHCTKNGFVPKLLCGTIKHCCSRWITHLITGFSNHSFTKHSPLQTPRALVSYYNYYISIPHEYRSYKISKIHFRSDLRVVKMCSKYCANTACSLNCTSLHYAKKQTCNIFAHGAMRVKTAFADRL